MECWIDRYIATNTTKALLQDYHDNEHIAFPCIANSIRAFQQIWHAAAQLYTMQFKLICW